MKLKPDEFAATLKIPIGTVERWVRQGKIPIRESAGYFFFDEKTLEKWAALHQISFSLSETHADKVREPEKDALTSAMHRGGIFYDIPGESVESVLKNAVSLLTGIAEDDKKQLFDRMMEREKLTSTGIGQGIAIPHPRTTVGRADAEPFIGTCFLKNGIDFAAIDGKPVRIMFLLVCPSIKSHLYLLSRLSFCLRDHSFVDFLKTSPPPAAFYEKIAVVERRLE